MKKLSIIIPCYNEELGIDNLQEKIEPVLKKLKKDWDLELIFVDDGSTDKTNQLLHEIFGNKNYVKIIKHKKNMNLGAAMRTGFSNATGDIVATMDSDCTYNPENIFPMLEMLDEDTDIVTASPYHPQGSIGKVPKYRLFLSKSITTIYRALTNSKIYTFTALFRVQKRKVIENISFKSNDFLATAEILIKAMNKGYQVKEYPTTLNVRIFGESKIKLMTVIWSHFKFSLGLLFLKLFKAKK